MKKILVYLFLTMFIFTPVFAQENTPKKKNFFVNIRDSFSYQNQLKFEEKYKAKLLEDLKNAKSLHAVLTFFVPSNFLLAEDYKYFNESKGSFLGDLYNMKKKFESSTELSNKEFNINILDVLINKIIKLSGNYNTYTEKIKLTNNDIECLDKELLAFVVMFNVYMLDDSIKEMHFENIDKYINEILKAYSLNFEDNKNNLVKLSELDASIDVECQKLRALSEDIDKFNKHGVNYADKVARKAMDVNNQLVKLSSSINTYGRNIEKGQYLNWLKKNNLKEISNIPLYSFVYGTNYSEPNKNLLYAHQPIYPIQVLQSVSGGVLLTGSHAIPQADNIQIIFMETNKKYADGQIIRKPIVAEYKGIYQYYNVLGTKNSVYKFRELTQTEINKRYNFKHKFYFYEPY